MNTNEDSSLHALRELREVEKRRLRQEEQARSKLMRERAEREQAQARVEQERRAREEAARQAAEARERAESSRLGRELETARAEIAHLRGEVERAHQGQAQASASEPRWPRHARSAGWLGITAGATMLVGALALAAVTEPKERPRSVAETPTHSSPSCPATSAPVTGEPKVVPAVATVEPSLPKKLRPTSAGRPHGGSKPEAGPTCDFATDPLCGIPTKVIDDVGKKPRKR